MFVLRVLGWLFGGRSRARKLSQHRTRRGRSFPVRVVRVQDGDSLIVRASDARNDGEIPLRLYAIDAPEMDQEYGREARGYLGRLVRNRTDLILQPVDTDRYGRLVGVLFYMEAGPTQSVNRLMVEQGLARWYSRYGGHGLGLEQAERNARRRRRGIWAGGGTTAPWEHRRARRDAVARRGCLKWVLLAAVIVALVCVAWQCGALD